MFSINNSLRIYKNCIWFLRIINYMHKILFINIILTGYSYIFYVILIYLQYIKI
jgi:hypothetical protein